MKPVKQTKVVIGFRLEHKYLEHLEGAFPDVRFVLSQSKAGLLEAVRDADVLFGWPSDPVIEAASNLRWLHLVGAGVDGFTAQPVMKRGIRVTNSRGVAASNIAEHVLSLMLAFARSLPILARAQQNQLWTKNQQIRPFEISGQTLGIIGLGEIGRALASKAGALGMKVLGASRSAKPVPGVERVFGVSDLTQLAAQVDHLVACLPATPETAGMINRTLFSVMKPESYFYNVGRGSTVVTEDLVEALHRAGMAGAGLDVVDPEPLPVGHPLWHHPNVIMTSHTAGETNQYWERAVAQFEQNLRHYLSGNALVNSVDLVKGY